MKVLRTHLFKFCKRLKVFTFHIIVLQTAPQQPAVCGLLEDVLRNMARVTKKVVIKKVEFAKAVEKVILQSWSLQRKYNERAVKACLAGGPTVLDDALFYLSKTGKVQFHSPSLVSLKNYH